MAKKRNGTETEHHATESRTSAVVVGGSSLKFLATVLVGAVAMLLILLWRTSPDPTVSAAIPAPRSTVLAGMTTISVEIQGASPLSDAALMVDGYRVLPTLDRLTANRWRVSYQANVKPGSHVAEIIAHDVRERTQHFNWQFTVAADDQPPQITEVRPAAGRSIAAGQIEFSAIVIDHTPLSAATLRVANRILALQIAPAPDSTAQPALASRQRLIARTSLAAGHYQVDLVVRDSGGLTANHSWQIVVAGMGA